MSIEFKCSNCSTTLRVDEKHLGKRAKCPHCETVNVVQPGSDLNAPVKSDGLSSDFPAMPGFAGSESSPTANQFSAPGGSTAGSPYVQGPAQSYGAAHRGGLILTMGIMSIVCNLMLIPGIMAWVMGRADLRDMKAGLMDREGEGITQAGMIMGIIGTILGILGMLFTLAYFAFIFIIIAGAAAGAQ